MRAARIRTRLDRRRSRLWRLTSCRYWCEEIYRNIVPVVNVTFYHPDVDESYANNRTVSGTHPDVHGLLEAGLPPSHPFIMPMLRHPALWPLPAWHPARRKNCDTAVKRGRRYCSCFRLRPHTCAPYVPHTRAGGGKRNRISRRLCVIERLFAGHIGVPAAGAGGYRYAVIVCPFRLSVSLRSI